MVTQRALRAVPMVKVMDLIVLLSDQFLGGSKIFSQQVSISLEPVPIILKFPDLLLERDPWVVIIINRDPVRGASSSQFLDGFVGKVQALTHGRFVTFKRPKLLDSGKVPGTFLIVFTLLSLPFGDKIS